MKATYVSNKCNYFEVGNGSRRTLQRVPEMMDTPPIQNNDAFIINMRNKIYSRYRGSLNEFRRSIKGNRKIKANNR